MRPGGGCSGWGMRLLLSTGFASWPLKESTSRHLLSGTASQKVSPRNPSPSPPSTARTHAPHARYEPTRRDRHCRPCRSARGDGGENFGEGVGGRIWSWRGGIIVQPGEAVKETSEESVRPFETTLSPNHTDGTALRTGWHYPRRGQNFQLVHFCSTNADQARWVSTSAATTSRRALARPPSLRTPTSSFLSSFTASLLAALSRASTGSFSVAFSCRR
jgi:hypothetical protein